MKKLLIGTVAIALCLGMNSCKNEAAATDKETPSTEQISQETSDSNGPTTESTEQFSDATSQTTDNPSEATADLLAKAKAEGANWSVDQWKGAFKDMMLIAKPMIIIVLP